ncbi:MAG: cysteine--tRNA ligase [Planctomycetales bacterium]|nr:cysteine--tRNA ligase [Planctomycetales bacterium]
MPLRVYNTLTRQKEDFQTVIPGKVGMYLCGPTVYKPAHIGHMVGPVIFDTVKRYLTYSGYEVKWIVNITDVDDKLINRARESGTTVEALAKQMTQDYFDNLATMGIAIGRDGIDQTPYATQHIPEMLDMIQRLIDKGYAYPLDGDVYFDVTKDADYGALSNRRLDELIAGSRVEASDRKRHPADFALWKASKPGEPSWDSPWGPGRPGWHIECSAMSLKHIGETLDIHGGGLDLMFPHHENELAQSESCTEKKFARYWLHNGLMQAGSAAGKVGGGHDRHGDLAEKEAQEAGKIAGSKGAASVKELFEKFPPETIRFFLLATHYRSPIQFSDENIAETGKSIEGFYRLFETYSRITGHDFYSLPIAKTRAGTSPLPDQPAEFISAVKSFRDRFLDAMDDDFNTGGAVGVLFELRKVVNGFIADQKLESTGKSNTTALATLTSAVTQLKELANLLGVFIKPLPKQAAGADDGFAGELMNLILELRAEARTTKNWPMSDKIRDRLKELKVIVEDRPDGVTWRQG